MSGNGSGASISTFLNIFCVSNLLPTHFSRILKILPFFATHYQNRLPTSCSHAIRQYIGRETGDQRTSRAERIITSSCIIPRIKVSNGMQMNGCNNSKSRAKRGKLLPSCSRMITCLLYFSEHTPFASTFCSYLTDFSKIRYDLNELPDSTIQQLFVMLFDAAKHFKNSPTSVRNEICLVIATLLIRWTGVTDIVNVAVQNIGTSETDTMLLNVLSLLPIELQSRRV